MRAARLYTEAQLHEAFVAGEVAEHIQPLFTMDQREDRADKWMVRFKAMEESKQKGKRK